MKKIVCFFMAAYMVIGCGSMSQTAKGTLIGSGTGAAIGSGLGYLFGRDGKSAAIGAAIGTAIGAGTGAVIGKKMDKKAEELAKLESAKVEKVEDSNGLQAIKVTFDSGILFPTNGTSLTAKSKVELAKFAKEMNDMKDTDITIYGHTDNTGSKEVNDRISKQRADAVSAYLQSCGMAASRMKSEGLSYNCPIADNATKEGRAQNRRVEIFITANEKMVKDAESGNLK